nr:MAG TPA: UcrQ family protein [Caudoviricetes sp.]
MIYSISPYNKSVIGGITNEKLYQGIILRKH